ncbi:MAG: hypothetical protein FWF53_00820 [Candidatus Azobacteroides sp.]|nr:hypothetical protein [Candidatus Azobacteroides sp.]
MKKVVNLLLFCTGLFLLSSCGGKNYTQDAKGYAELQSQLQSKFGADAYYTDIHIAYSKSTGNIVSVSETTNPSSLKMNGWIFMQGVWKQNTDITLEIEGGKAEDFMFQLGKEVDLAKVGGMIEASKKKLAEEKKMENTVAEIVAVQMPKSGGQPTIFISLEPKNGGTKFSFFYDSDGNLKNFSY